MTYVTDSEIFRIEAIVDKNLLEFFINDGELYYVTAFNGTKKPVIEASIAGPQNTSRVSAPRKFFVKNLEVFELSSIWNE